VDGGGEQVSDNEFIPASLRIGTQRSLSDFSPPKPTTDDLMRIINSTYAEYLKNQVDWQHNDTRDLILKMKIALERITAERDEARREVCQNYPYPNEYAIDRDWNCFKE
jgi:hypothetical protein